MPMSCKKTELLIVDSQSRKLSEQENSDLQIHLERCKACAEQFKHENILSNILHESSTIDETYIIPQEIMRLKVEKQVESSSKFSIRIFFKTPLLVPVITAIIIIVALTKLNAPTDLTTYEYTVDLDGINIDIVEGDETLCDMLYTIGLPDASIDVIACNTTCKLVIFDLKSQQEAEKVVHILNQINSESINTKINKIKQYNIS